MVDAAMAVGEGEITIKPVPVKSRMSFLPKNFGAQFMLAERYLFDMANRCIPKEQYSGYFHYEYINYADGAKAPLLRHSTDEQIEFTNLFGRTEIVSSRCASAILTTLVLIRLIESGRISEKLHDMFCDQYYLLFEAGREFARQDGCSREFFNLTD